MPTYEYKCQHCGHTFEAFQSMKDEPLSVCEICNGLVKRMIGAGAGIIFKGSGFYCTDYRSESYNAQVKKDTTGKGKISSQKADAKSQKPEVQSSKGSSK